MHFSILLEELSTSLHAGGAGKTAQSLSCFCRSDSSAGDTYGQGSGLPPHIHACLLDQRKEGKAGKCPNLTRRADHPGCSRSPRDTSRSPGHCAELHKTSPAPFSAVVAMVDLNNIPRLTGVSCSFLTTIHRPPTVGRRGGRTGQCAARGPNQLVGLRWNVGSCFQQQASAA